MDPAGLPWAIRKNRTIVRLQPDTQAAWLEGDSVADAFWQHVLPNSLAIDIGVGPDGAVWIVGTDCRVYQYAGNTWAQISGMGYRIAVGPGDQPLLVGRWLDESAL